MSQPRNSKFTLTMLVLGFVFLYAPILSLIVYSFNESRLVTVWSGFSVKWYGELFRDQQMMSAAWVSVQVAFWTACASVVLGTSYFFVLFILGSGFGIAVMGMVASALGRGDETQVRVLFAQLVAQVLQALGIEVQAFHEELGTLAVGLRVGRQ